MAELVITSSRVSGAQIPAVNTLSVDDILTYQASQTIIAHLDNVTVGAIIVTFNGDAGTTVTCPGLGDPIDVSGGYSVTIPAGEKRFVMLSSIKDYLQGVISVTSDSAGAEATLYQL